MYNWINKGVRLMYSRYSKQARNRKYEFSLSKEFFTLLVTYYKCFYCQKPPYQITYGSLVLGIDRKDNNVGYIEDNCVPCCKECNFAKGTMPAEKYLTKLSNGKKTD